MAEIVKKRPLTRDPERKSAQGYSSVIESEVFDASRKARTIVQEAEEKAAQILETAQKEAVDKYEQAKNQGFIAGQTDGLQKFEAAILEVNREHEKFLGQAEEEILKLSTAVVRKLVHAELKLNPKVIVDIVRKALLPMNRKHSITLRVHPEDQKILETSRGELMDIMINQSHIVFMGDANITRGGCIVETEHGTVDARLDRQFAFLAGLITGQEEHFAPAEPAVEAPSVSPHPAFSSQDAEAETYVETNLALNPAAALEDLAEEDEGFRAVEERFSEVFEPARNLPEPEPVEPAIPVSGVNLIEDMEELAKGMDDKEDLSHLLSRLDDLLSEDGEGK